MKPSSTPLTSFHPPLAFDRTTTATLAAAGSLLMGLTLIATLAFPRWSASSLPPAELAIWFTLFLSALFAVSQFRHRSAETLMAARLSVFAVISAIVLQFFDLGIDWQGSVLSSRIADVIIAIVAAVVASLLVLNFANELRGRRWLAAALWSVVAFFGLIIIAEFIELRSPFTATAVDEIHATEFFELLAIELYLVGSVLAAGRSATASTPLLAADSRALGTFARQSFSRLNLVREARHPPLLIAFVPGVGDVIAVLSSGFLVFYAGLPLKRATGIGLWRQFGHMLALWSRLRIDPPSYYALDLYKPANRAKAAKYLTRYETKNGLLHVLNYELQQGPPKGELNDKLRFAAICREAGIDCPQTLALVTPQEAVLHVPTQMLMQDLFCKPLRGMGAIGTHCYRYDSASDSFLKESGERIPASNILAELRAKSVDSPLLIQPWLENHPEIADLADTSLLVFRVITCLDSSGQPVVCMAMLRLLAKLEDRWHSVLPDGEYASPIDIGTGVLGPFTGDDLRTAAYRYAAHPVNSAPIQGRRISNWLPIALTALATHRAFRGRAVVGWDIALTPHGPVVLEGNSNFDVMFLQRVVDQPIGATRLGELMRPMIEALYRRK